MDLAATSLSLIATQKHLKSLLFSWEKSAIQSQAVAIAGATISAISIFQRTKQPSIALTEEWIATQVADGDSITVRLS